MKTKALTLAALIVSTSLANAGSGGPDLFGYEWFDSDHSKGADFQWIDISDTGTQVLAPGAGNKANIDLEPALIFYGERYETIAVSENGYISTDPSDNGGDNSNDCPFPGAISSGAGARIAVLHDDLEVTGDGGIYHQYFPSSPHSWHPAGVHVIQWENVQHVGAGGFFDFQILLFDNFDIVMQYGFGNAEDGSGSTTGIQNLQSSLGLAPGNLGLKVACDFAGGIPDNYAVTILPPRVTVTSAADSATTPGTLRAARALAENGTRIEFSPSLSGATIDLSIAGGGIGSGIAFPEATCVSGCTGNQVPTRAFSKEYIAIDASALEDGVRIVGPSGGETFRTWIESSIPDLRLAGLILESDGTQSVENIGRLTAHGCTFHSGSVRAITSSGDLKLTDCDLVDGQLYVFKSHIDRDIDDPVLQLFSTSISGSDTPALQIDSGYADVVVEDCSISANFADAIQIDGDSNLSVRNSIVAFNTGIGISTACDSGNLVEVIDSTILFNLNTSTRKGGGILHGGEGDLVLLRSAVSQNSVNGPGSLDDLGGGLYIASTGDTTILDCSFSGNSAGFGSAVFTEALAGPARQFTATRSTFSGNTALINTALYFANTGVDLKLCTISENIGNFALHIEDTGSNTLEQSTIICDSGNAIRLRDLAELDVSGTVVTCSGGAFDSEGSVRTMGHNLSNLATPEFDDITDITSADPMLGALGFYGGKTKTHAVLAGSPLIDAGDPGPIPLVGDQRGFDRYVDGDGDGTDESDIGAVEFQGNLTVTTAVDETATPGTGLSLREALASADPGSIIDFAPGLGGATFLLDAPLVVNTDLSIDASQLANPPTISGQNSHRVFEINSGSASFTNLTFVDGFGGGLKITGVAKVTLDQCTVRRCKNGGGGGGIYVGPTATLDVRDSTISGNETNGAGGTKGGGIFGEAGSTIKLLRTQISGNTTFTLGKGGGIAFEGTGSNPGALEITRCSIVNNSAGDDGGGLFFDGANGVTITSSTISGNVSENGRGGGAFAVGESSVNFRHSTIADNRSDTNGGGLHSVGSSSFSLGHTILAANRNASGLRNGPFNKITSTGYNLCDDDSLEISLLGIGDITHRAAHLAPLANYGSGVLTHALLAISPAIDGGNAVVRFPPPVDQRGFGRIANGQPGGGTRIDIGAVEAAKPIIVDTAFDETNIITNTTSLREALRDAVDGGRIVFDPALSGEGIHLGASQSGQGELIIDKSVQIDATLLPGGIGINGDDETRCFRITGNRPVSMHAIEIKNGRSSVTGGGILSDGELVLTYCTLRGNRAANGGGAIACGEGSVFAWNCSLVGNDANNLGSAVRLLSAARGKFHHCTVADNGTGNGQPAIGIDESPLVFYSSIIADNGANFLNAGSVALADLLTSDGYNLNDDTTGGVFAAFDGPGDQNGAAPQLGTLNGDSGGWGPIITILSGSPARDAGDPMVSLLSSFEVRGYLRVQGSAIDIGAVEFESKTEDSDSDGMPDWWELLYGLDPEDASDASEDPDLDFSDNLEEFQNGTHPFKSGVMNELKILHVQPGLLPASLEITFASDPGGFYTIEFSPDLNRPYLPALGAVGEVGSNQTTVVVQGGNLRGFFRVRRE